MFVNLEVVIITIFYVFVSMYMTHDYAYIAGTGHGETSFEPSGISTLWSNHQKVPQVIRISSLILVI